MNYLLHILIMVAIYTILSFSLNLLIGQTGLLSLCHAAFYGVGAYVVALIGVKLGWPFWLALPIAVAFTAGISMLISYPTIRLKGDYFILGSLAFQVIVVDVLRNWESLTGGTFGVTGIPSPTLFGIDFGNLYAFTALALIVAVICGLVVWGILVSPFGRVLKAIRDDEIAAEALGRSATSFKVKAFALAAGLAAVAGGIFAVYVSFIDPSSFTVDETLFIVACVIVGGAGNMKGPFIGAIALVVLPELLRFINVPDSIAANVRQIIYGLMIVVFMRFRPQGLWGNYQLR